MASGPQSTSHLKKRREAFSFLASPPATRRAASFNLRNGFLVSLSLLSTTLCRFGRRLSISAMPAARSLLRLHR